MKELSPTIYLFQKWAFKVQRGWCGFDVEGIPFEWANKIDEFLTWMDDYIPSFDIHQIKLKYGCVRFYLNLGAPECGIESNILKEYQRRLNALETLCCDKKLIY